MKFRILVAGLMLGMAAMAAETGAELFQKALTAERAAGNLEEAIKLYQRIAKEFASDRALAAKALVQEARCYEKLGKDNAVKIYEQVAREYKDQPEPFAMASARLAALKVGERPATAAMTQRRIDLPYPSQPTYTFFSTDGHREVYRDASTGAVMMSNLAGTEKRVIFKPKPGEQVAFFLPSRDFSVVALSLNRQNGSVLAFTRTDGTDYRDMGRNFGLQGWSWDSRSLIAIDTQKSPPEVVRISVADGEIRTVRTFDGGAAPLGKDLAEFYATIGMRLIEGRHLPSPDGRFFAVADDEAFVRLGKISIVPSQGGEPKLLADNARLIDWTRDGRYLIIVSERSGSEALYLLPIRDGRQAGDPIFVRYGSFRFGQTTVEGSLVYQSTPAGGSYQAWLGALDSDGRPFDWNHLGLTGSSRVALEPRWSPDSAQIVYTSNDDAVGQNTFVIRARNMTSGEEREVYRGKHTECIWAAQRPAVFCNTGIQTDPVHMDTFSIATGSGHVEQLPPVRLDNGGFFFSSLDDRAIYGWRVMFGGPGPELIRLDATTMQATVLDRIPGPFGWGNWLGLEPDEHWIARRVKDTTEIRPMSSDGMPSGDWKPLLSVGDTQMSFTPDGKWVIYHDVDSAGRQSLFRISTSGGQPERIGDFPTDSRTGHLRISPDGKKIIAESPVAPEVWVLENFEPKQQAAR
jgi:hypothetical protein